MTIETWLWIGVIGMALGFAGLAVISRGRTEEEANSTVLHTYVPLIAAGFYLLMAIGQGAIAVEGGTRLFYFARYLDWSVTTPLLLLGLAYTALGSLRGHGALVAALIGADIYMIITGLFAGLSPSGSAAKWVWYIVSCGAFLAVYYVLWGPLAKMAKARSAEKAKLYARNAAILSVVWLFYPIVFFVGSEGVNVVAPVLAIAAFTILDLIAKVGYGFLALGEHRAAATRAVS